MIMKSNPTKMGISSSSASTKMMSANESQRLLENGRNGTRNTMVKDTHSQRKNISLSQGKSASKLEESSSHD
jgi:hypothetical protein